MATAKHGIAPRRENIQPLFRVASRSRLTATPEGTCFEPKSRENTCFLVHSLKTACIRAPDPRNGGNIHSPFSPGSEENTRSAGSLWPQWGLRWQQWWSLWPRYGHSGDHCCRRRGQRRPNGGHCGWGHCGCSGVYCSRCADRCDRSRGYYGCSWGHYGSSGATVAAVGIIMAAVRIIAAAVWG
jgi:hypothetical protein